MTVQNRSKWFYGHNIDSTNFYLDFNEGGSELTAELNVGSYSFTEFTAEIARAMTEAAGAALEYTVTPNRIDRTIIISALSSFSLLVNSGSHAGTSVFSLAGFTGSDLTGGISYEGNIASGNEYKPQFPLQSYVDFEDYQQAAFSKINKSASGIVEAISFGIEKFMECNVSYVTDIDMGNDAEIETNLTAVNELRSFLEDATLKRTLEFMPDRDAPNIYNKCLLESTPLSREGTGFKLKELYGKGLANFYESGILKFRELT